MATDYVSLKQLSDDLGMGRSHARRYVLRHGIQPHKRRTPDSQNQLTLAVTVQEAEAIKAKRREEGFLDSAKPITKEVGVFYVIRLVPELDPRRIKLGYADDLASRLSQHRTAAPTAVVIKSWACKRAWEGTVMDCLTAAGCRLILNEVFECEAVDDLLARGEALFALLGDPAIRTPLSEVSPHNR
ncbi:MAG: hypothetical protein HY674_01695 [Chloroflexi bacterium]|nr:hypothetical protein [Chloroflexota bacterium]